MPGRRAAKVIGGCVNVTQSLRPDAAIVWLARETGCRAILTVDVRDFGVYRIKGNKRFEIVKWFS